MAHRVHPYAYAYAHGRGQTTSTRPSARQDIEPHTTPFTNSLARRLSQLSTLSTLSVLTELDEEEDTGTGGSSQDTKGTLKASNGAAERPTPGGSEEAVGPIARASQEVFGDIFGALSFLEKAVTRSQTIHEELTTRLESACTGEIDKDDKDVGPVNNAGIFSSAGPAHRGIDVEYIPTEV
ncbi:hypothetical protein PLEOSDRAFT_160894 [Pleurotus ostreatus PC15]|uniref:Uncharacterized protein n=1 Tax=Pleurotus ostreatus (strain PC15) TaxID=1137138 RepID=A0A067NDN4_PLEO1|nr:hypothetical protein PLEOSDRAFT_160894 [Pleurotus ostreatus PC15]